MRNSSNTISMRGALAPLIFVGSVALASASFAADENGKFAIKGGGLQSCEKFTTALAEKTQDVALYGGWIEGFVTAQNQHTEDTFDITPWQTTNTLLLLTKAFCEQAPDSQFINAFASVYRLLFPSRLQTESEVIGISNGQQSAIGYREIFKRAQQALRDNGIDVSDTNGDFDAASIQQLKDYQTSNGLEVTGLLDQPTLYSLFFKN